MSSYAEKNQRNIEKGNICSIEDCGNAHRALGFCNKHWLRFHKHGDPNKGPKIGCEFAECSDKHWGRGYCKDHYRTVFPEVFKKSSIKKNGWTPELWDFVFNYQNGQCAIEGCTTELLDGIGNSASDHDHITGEPRAILCGPCNRSLGMMNENPEKIRGLMKYAEQCQNSRRWV